LAFSCRAPGLPLGILIEAFKQGLREQGYAEGQTLILERRYGETRAERLSDLAAELVRAKVDVIVAVTDLAIWLTREHTQTIPIVMVSTDPVGTGLIASLARPAGHHPARRRALHRRGHPRGA